LNRCGWEGSRREAPDGGWDLDQSIALARQLGPLGVDLIDCSSGGNLPQVTIPIGPGYQTPFAERIRRETGMLTGAIGLLTAPAQAGPYYPYRAGRHRAARPPDAA
jgi:2,4-dienoyl-CoA reductase-like NADH-dependent reductase (Old Yellow Enzyme family)